MDDDFEIPVNFKNEELSFPGKLLSYGYSFKIEIDINGTKVLFERDEERNWRALLSYEDVQANKKLNVELVKAIGESIETLLK